MAAPTTLFRSLHNETKARVLDALRERVVQAIESNEDLRWDGLLSGISGFVNAATGRAYRGHVNNLLLAITSATCDGDPRYLTFCQLRSLSAGKGRVRAGTRMTPVFAPILREAEEPENGETRKRSILVGYRVVWLANVRQTNLIDLGFAEEHWFEPSSFSLEPIQTVLDFANRIPFKQTTSHGAPFYCPGTDRIGMPPTERFRSSFGFAEALLHELSHWTGASQRLNRLSNGWTNKADYSSEELTASLSSSFLLAHLGVDFSHEEIDRQSAYLRHWLRPLQEDISLLVEAAAEAAHSVNYLVALANGSESEGIRKSGCLCSPSQSV